MSGWADATRREGFAHMPGLIDTALIASLRDAVLASLAIRGSSDVVAVQCDVMALELVRQLRQEPRLITALAGILGAPPEPLHADVLRIFPPGAPPTPPHKDADYVPRDPLWIAWIPLDVCPIERGPLVIWPSRGGPSLPSSPGDAILFSSQTEHCTLPNLSTVPRLSMDFRYGLPRPRKVE